MATSGFFLGGAAEGMETARKAALSERELDANVGLKTRGLDLQERQIDRTEQNDLIARADKQVADTMSIVAETIKQGLAVGRTPEQIRAAVAPLVASASQIRAKIGGNPAALAAQVDAMLTGPTGLEAATAAGRAKGTQEGVTQRTAAEVIQGPGGTGEGFIVDPAKRAEEEGKLRDDYVARSKDFITLRDFKDRIDSAPTTGAGDIALVFSYMKVLDPTSTVREGEYATANNAAGVPDAIRGMWNKLVGGGNLSSDARTQIKSSANTIWTKAAERHSNLTNQFAAIAKRRGINPNNVIIDFNPSAPVTGRTPSGLNFTVTP
jgi:hypothetical protein